MTTAMKRKQLQAEESTVVNLWPDTAGYLGIGRTKIYELAAAGELPFRVLRLGNKYKVPTAELRRALGVDDPHDDAA